MHTSEIRILINITTMEPLRKKHANIYPIVTNIKKMYFISLHLLTIVSYSYTKNNIIQFINYILL